MKVRQATTADLSTILQLIETGRQKMIAAGNRRQWTPGHPSRETLEADVSSGNSYLLLSDDDHRTPVATFAFIIGNEPTYATIEQGAWLNDEPYGTVHRVASAEGIHGVMPAITRYCAQRVGNIRIDTHADNTVMQKALLRLGYTPCGIIHLSDGAPRLAYQLTLSPI